MLWVRIVDKGLKWDECDETENRFGRRIKPDETKGEKVASAEK